MSLWTPTKRSGRLGDDGRGITNGQSGTDLRDIQPSHFPDLNQGLTYEDEKNLSEEFIDHLTLMDTSSHPNITVKKEAGALSSCIYAARDHGNHSPRSLAGELEPEAPTTRSFGGHSISDDQGDVETDDISFGFPGNVQLTHLLGNHGSKYGSSSPQQQARNSPALTFAPSTTTSRYEIRPASQGLMFGGHVQVQSPSYPGPTQPFAGVQQHPTQISVATQQGSVCVANGNSPSAAPQQGQAASQPSNSSQVQVDENGECALHYMSVMTNESQCLKYFQALLAEGEVARSINLRNKRQQTPLFLAVQQNNLILVPLLLQHGADPNIQGCIREGRDNVLWRSPVHLAASGGDENLPILKNLLVCPSAKRDALTIGDRLTALHLALKSHRLRRNCRNTIFTLLRCGVNIRIREERTSQTVLMMAIETRDVLLVRDLLNQLDTEQCRVMLQEQMRSGDTCLHVAAGLSKISSQEKEGLLRLLVTKGANGNIPNNAKELPRDYARDEWNRLRNI